MLRVGKFDLGLESVRDKSERMRFRLHGLGVGKLGFHTHKERAILAGGETRSREKIVVGCRCGVCRRASAVIGIALHKFGQPQWHRSAKCLVPGDRSVVD